MRGPINISADEVAGALPRGYGEVECNFDVVQAPNNDRVGLVIPTWRRYEYLKTCLNSLRRSQLTDTILCIVDESDSEGLKEFDDYRLFKYLDSPGHDLLCIHGSIEEIKARCDCHPECVAFNSLGYLKYRINPPEAWITKRNGEIGIYVKNEAACGICRKSEPLPRSRTVPAIKAFEMANAPTIKIFKKRHANMADSLRVGWDLLSNVLGCSFLSCLDADTKVKQNWIERLLRLHRHFENKIHNPYYIISGLNTPNHPVAAEYDHYYLKESIGGANMFFHRRIYHNLRRSLSSIYWDAGFVHRIRAMKGKLICTKPSVVQHIGKVGIWSGDHGYDFAEDFDWK